MLRNGWLIVETITSRMGLSRLKTEFERAEIPFEILSITQKVDVAKLLTDRQWKLITEALDRGYYDSPRGCTLTELAAAMDVNPSAVSGVLHRAEEHIIRTFVTEAKQSDDLDLPG
jgi:predicted DNA binding protein